MTGLTLRTLTRWLTPWRTIRRLEVENQRLREQAVLRARFNCEAQKLVDLKYEQLAMAREALRRLVHYYADQDYDSEVVRGVYLWATDNGMTGPLPPLPDHIAKRDQPTTEDQP
jgi:hypothetical protein